MIKLWKLAVVMIPVTFLGLYMAVKDVPNNPATQTSFEIQSEDVRKKKCLPKQHIMFLKTHKCASSSVQNMFLRYGYINNLTFALPDSRNYLGNPEFFHTGLIPSNLMPSSQVVDIFAVHTRLNMKENKKIMPPDTYYVTVLRDPVGQFESMYKFFGLDRQYAMSLPSYLMLPLQKQMSYRRKDDKLGYNMMLFDLGYTIDGNMSATELRGSISTIDYFFDIVLIAEKMDESLILLMHKLCWDFRDIVFLNKNKRSNQFVETLTELHKEQIRKLNAADLLLYNHFLLKHEIEVLKFGRNRMAREVSRLRNLRERMTEECGTITVSAGESKHLFEFSEHFLTFSSGMVESYITNDMSNVNCVLLALPEMTLLDKIRDRQKEFLSH